ncbi:hypothetical protein ACJRO7_010941, partial [Eucalyptus globulus]
MAESWGLRLCGGGDEAAGVALLVAAMIARWPGRWLDVRRRWTVEWWAAGVNDAAR